MNQAELIEVVSSKTGHTKADTKLVIKTALDSIIKEVQLGGKITIVGFGSFFSADRKARPGRNPQTGEAMKIPAAKVPRFHAGKDFKDRVNKKKKKK